MFSVFLWKEYREHRMVWAVLAFLGAAAILTLSMWFKAGWLDAPDYRTGQQMVAAVLVGIYALICGAMMLAGEYENRTMPYLDALPGFRRRLWQGKFVAGVLLVLGQIVLLMILCAAGALFRSWHDAALTLAAMFTAGLYGLSWGLLFSSLGRSVLSVILLSLAAQAASFLLTGVLARLLFGLGVAIYGMGQDADPGTLWYVLFVLTAPAALIGSAVVFTRLDRRRLRAAPERLRVQKRTFHPTWSMLFWLTWRQARGFAAGLAAFALLLGFLLPLQSLILWPVATLVVGVLCGATAFADEQQGSFRFLGDQRLPLGRLWIVKVGVRFAVAVVAALLVLAPSLIATLANIPESRWSNPQGEYHLLAHLFHSDLLVNLCPPLLFLTLWLVYGFSSGCLFGLLFRHGLAAGVFALFTCALAAALWIPSLLAGGLHAWQVFGPPVLILAASRLIMRPWAAGRIASQTTAVRLTPFVLLAGLWIAGGLWYLVLEIPYVPQRFDLDAFRASQPTPEQDESGQLFRSACLRFNDLRQSLESQQMFQGGVPGAIGVAMPGAPPGMAAPGAMPGPPGMMAPAPPGGMPQPAAAPMEPPPSPPMERARDALEHGWPAKDRDLALWLDKMHAGDWAATLKKAADLPTSPFDDVRNMTLLEPLKAANAAWEVAVVLAVRGLQRQAAGDDEAYAENLRVGLALSRSLRDHTPTEDLITGRVVQGYLLTGLDRWLQKLHGRSDLIQKALALLSSHLEATANDAKDQELIDDLLIKNTVDDPFIIIQGYLAGTDNTIQAGAVRVREETLWVATAWLVPWERDRQARLLRVLFERERDKALQDWIRTHAKDLGPLPELGPYHSNFEANPRPLCAARAMQLKLALRWFQADNGKPADHLDELVPKYLPSIPLDPYDGEPFRYELSRGEEIVMPLGPGSVVAGGGILTQKVPAGQGILWSEGKDRVFLVPLPPKTK